MSRKKHFIDPDTLYHHWVYERKSLRKIAQIYGTSRTTVWETIRAKYGKHATNLRMNSLARVVAEEYRDLGLARRCRNSPGLFHSRRQENNRVVYHSLEYFDNLAYEPEEPEEGLRLPLFIRFTELLLKILTDAMYGRRLQKTH